ncbi:MAG: hypothetical protein MJZ34_03130 [Paludibacteraceae bacterium]|nr:hypothetical protein [Paludibacteraceae bacterium]
MYLILRKVDTSGNYDLCYRYRDLEEAKAKYQELLETIPPSKLSFVETSRHQLYVDIDDEGCPTVTQAHGVPLATTDYPGIVQLATILEADYDDPKDYVDGVPVCVTPSLVKYMIDSAKISVLVPDATTETKGVVRLANEEESAYETANNGPDGLAVLQPEAAKRMQGYVTEYAPSVSNIKEALDDIYATIYYVPLAITSFTVKPGTGFEVGQSVDLMFTWSYNKNNINEQTFEGESYGLKVRDTIVEGVSSNHTFSLRAFDGKTTVGKTLTVSFMRRIFWGADVKRESFDSDWLRGLEFSQLKSNYKGSYTADAARGTPPDPDLYMYIACPEVPGDANWKMPDMCVINNWDTELYNCGTIEHTNDYGVTMTYRIYRTTQDGIGKTTMVFN